MIKKLIRVGSKSALILPAVLIKRYKLKNFIIEARDDGVLIRPVESKTSFQKKMQISRKNKTSIYKKMEEEANDPKTIAFYDNPDNTFGNLDSI